MKENKTLKIKELFIKRDNLSESWRTRNNKIMELRKEFEKSIEPKIEHLNFLKNEIDKVRSELHGLGVDAEDC